MATQQRNNQRDNQNLQNTANQRSEELKPSGRVTGAGETSTTSTASSTNVDGRVGTDDRDVETDNASDNNRASRVGDDQDYRNH